MLLQLLPAALRAQQRSGTIAFLDFQKAYDTVDRSFLLAVMQQVGAGTVGADGASSATGMVRWAQALLSHTTSVAVVNGHVSHHLRWEAGVRQGCPLAPAMYLFVAWALNCWLKHQGIGMHLLGPQRVPCGQYADDASVLLEHWDQPSVETLSRALTTFGDASGQRLNVSKSQLLPIGCVPDPVPMAPVCGMAVVSQAKTLGIPFSNAPTASSAHWPELLQRVTKAYNKVARLSLSVFGRAFAAAGYGISKVLYHAEFSDPPPRSFTASKQ